MDLARRSSLRLRAALFVRGLSGCALAIAFLGCGRGEPDAGTPAARPARGPNVLFISVDDLRPALGCFGDERARTPRIDELAAGGVAFQRAYCSMAICTPSRASVLTGMRIETHRVADTTTNYRAALPEHVVLPELFLRAGYKTYSLGKVQHGQGELDDPRAWSEPPWRPERWQRYYGAQETRDAIARLEEEAREHPVEQHRVRFFAWEAPEVDDGELGDGLIAARAIELLERHKDEPFFLAVGFLKPHLPFVAPKQYWDLFPPGSLAPDEPRAHPAGAPDFTRRNSMEVRAYWNVPDSDEFDPETIDHLLRGYYACTSFIDAQVGRLLDALERLGLAENTVVALWGDHGWHLGDLGLWGKHTNYERAVRSPLIVRAPGRGVQGARSQALVELGDLYPTLAELCGLSAPANLESTSLVPLLEDPARPWKRAAFHLYPRHVPGVGELVGRAVRTDRYRLIEWTDASREFRVRELYDYQGPGERRSLAGDPELAEVEDELARLLRRGWRAALQPERSADPPVEPATGADRGAR